MRCARGLCPSALAAHWSQRRLPRLAAGSCPAQHDVVAHCTFSCAARRHAARAAASVLDECVQDPADVSRSALIEDGTACPRCSQAVDIFLQIIGAEAGHMALRNLASGGVYIAGAHPLAQQPAHKEGGTQRPRGCARAAFWLMHNARPFAGGIAPKLFSRIQEGDLYNSFTNQPASRFSKTIAQFPLHVVLNDKVGLLGTCEYAISMARQAQKAAI